MATGIVNTVLARDAASDSEVGRESIHAKGEREFAPMMKIRVRVHARPPRRATPPRVGHPLE